MAQTRWVMGIAAAVLLGCTSGPDRDARDAGATDAEAEQPDASPERDASTGTQDAEVDAATEADAAQDAGRKDASEDDDEDASTSYSCVPPALSGCDLHGADFHGQDLRGWDFSGANLNGADLRDTRLEETNFSGADLTDAKLAGAHTANIWGYPAALPAGYAVGWKVFGEFWIVGPGVNIAGLDLSGTSLNDVDLSGANLDDTILDDTTVVGLLAHELVACPDIRASVKVTCLEQAQGTFVLVGATLRLDGADLDGLDLSGIDFDQVHAEGVTCPSMLPADWQCVHQPSSGSYVLVGPHANLSDMNLEGVNLDDVNLSGARLSGTRLENASLRGTNLTGATLQPMLGSGADFTGANLSQVSLSGLDASGSDFSGVVLNGAMTADLLACPSALSSAYHCVAGGTNGFVLLGPGVTVSGAQLDGAVLDGFDLTDATLVFVSLSGASLAGATLTGLDATHISSCPDVLPTGFACVVLPSLFALGFHSYVILGPGAAPSGSLEGALASGVDLTGADLRSASLTHCDLRNTTLTGALIPAAPIGSVSGPIYGCPADLPSGYACVPVAGSAQNALIGRAANVMGLDLSGVNLSSMDLQAADLRATSLGGVDLSSALLDGAQTTELVACPLALPNASYACVAQPNGRFMIVGPALKLDGADLRGVDLSTVSLQDASLPRARTFDLLACPTSLPADTWTCVAQPQNGRYALLGPSVDLRGADLRDVDATGAVLDQALLSEASFAGAVLDGAHIQAVRDFRGTDLSGASIANIVLDQSLLRGLVGCPTLPSNAWHCLTPDAGGYALLGPGTDVAGDLAGADLTGVDLSSISYCFALRAFDLVACPSALPTGYSCLSQPMNGKYFVLGPGSDLRGADLRAVDFSAADVQGSNECWPDLRGANLGGATLAETPLMLAQDLLECPSSLPNSDWSCIAQANGSFAVVGPNARLQDLELEGNALAGVSLSTVMLTNVKAYELDACPTSVESFLECVTLSSGKQALIGSGTDLRGADLTGVTLNAGSRAYDLVHCPAVLPAGTTCVAQSNGHFAVVGQGMDMRGASLVGSDLSGVDMFMAVSTSALAERVRLYDLLACPQTLRGSQWCLPQANQHFVLLDNNADLRGADLSGVDLAHAIVIGAAAYDLVACPAQLPFGYACVPQPATNSFVLLGSDLRGADLTGVVTSDARVAIAFAYSPTDATTTCPNGNAGPCN